MIDHAHVQRDGGTGCRLAIWCRQGNVKRHPADVVRRRHGEVHVQSPHASLPLLAPDVSGPLGGRVGGEHAGQHHAAQNEAGLDLHEDLQATDVASGAVGRKAPRLPGQRRTDDQEVCAGDAQGEHEGDQFAQQGAPVGGDGERFGPVDVQVGGDGARGGQGQRGAERQSRKAPHQAADGGCVAGEVAAQQTPRQGGKAQQAAPPGHGCQDVHDVAAEGDDIRTGGGVTGKADRGHERQPDDARAQRPGFGRPVLRQREQSSEQRREDRLEQGHLAIARRR